MTKTNIFAYHTNAGKQTLFANNKANKERLAFENTTNSITNPAPDTFFGNIFNQINAFDSATNYDYLNLHLNASQNRAGGSSRVKSNDPRRKKDSEQKKKEARERRSRRALAGLKTKVAKLKASAYGGGSGCLEKLEELGNGKGDPRIEQLTIQHLHKLMDYAKENMDELITNAHSSPRLLSTFMKANKLNSASMEDLKPEKLIADSAFSSGALQMITKLVNSGLKLDGHIKKALSANPAKAIWGLTYLADQNLPKSARLSIAQALSNVAKDKSGSYLGVLAAKGLKSMIKSEGQNGILDQAFTGLRAAGTAGNGFAVHLLEEVARDHTVSYNKATKATKALSGIAQDNPHGPSGGQAVKSLYRVIHQQGENSILRAAFKGLKEASMKGNSKAVDALGSVALNGNMSLNKANKAVNALGDVVNSGQGQAPKALRVLKVLATDKSARFSVKQMARNKLAGLGVNMQQGRSLQFGNMNKKDDNKDLLKSMNSFAEQT